MQTQADYVLDYDVVSVAREQHVYLLARVTAGPPPNADRRQPLNLSVVLDRSGSMAGDKLDYVKKAAQFLVQRLGSNDRFSLVTYDSAVEVKVPAGPVVHKDAINQAIRGIQSGGTTNLSGGWLQGCQLVVEGRAEGQVNRVLLLTDGLANEGITDTARLVAMARQKREEGVTTTTIGVGLGFNEDLLTGMAAEGGGAFYFIDNPDQTPKIFAEELQDLLSVVGQNLVITLRLSSEVQLVRQLNTYPSTVQGHEITFRLGDLFADEIKMLLVELSIPALDRPGTLEIGYIRFDYDELGEDSVAHRSLELPIVIQAVAEEGLLPGGPNAEVAKTALLLQAARAREEAIRQADQGHFEQAQRILSDTADAIQRSGLEDEQLEVEHNMLREEAIDMELGAERYDAFARKATTTKTFYTSARTGTFRMMAMSSSAHNSHKRSRSAIERNRETPTTLRWKQEQLDLTGLDLVRIGRADDNDIVVQVGEVSAYHCQIVREGDDLYLEDLNSTNGTFANGGLVKTRFRLSAGDVVTVGSLLFTFGT